MRAEVTGETGPSLVDAEIAPAGRSRTQVNRKAVSARKDLAAAVPCTIFSPEDLALVGGAPKGRRDLLDDALALLDPEGARAADEIDRVLRQRAALLRQSGGRLTEDVATTLDVWDQRLAGAGKVLVAAREQVVADLEPLVAATYNRLAGADGSAGPGPPVLPALVDGRLLDALSASRTDDLRRGVKTVGPHRDELVLLLEGREARGHASQGEQRCLALALRLAVHELVRTRTDLRPMLLLDDVFSELDPVRSRALVAELPAGQSLLTTAAPLPEGIDVAAVVHVGGPASGEEPPAATGRGGSASPCRACSGGGGAAHRGARSRLHPLGRGGHGRARGPSRPIGVDRRALVVAADHPAWATRARLESADILARVHALGESPIRRLEVVVERP